MHIHVEKELCTSCGTCWNEFPAFFSHDQNMLSVVIQDHAPPALGKGISNIAHICPGDCIILGSAMASGSAHPKKVLVFCSDVVPVCGLATSGGGLRSWQIIQGLLENGYNAIYSVPQDRYLYRSQLGDLPEVVKENSWIAGNQDAIVQKHHPDIIIFANPDINYLETEYDIPYIGDLHGPRLIEHKFLYEQKGAATEAAIIQRTVEAFRQMDFLTCAGERQKYYFSAWLLLGGYEPDQIDIRNMPVSLSPCLPTYEKDPACPVFIYSGGFYPWQNSMRALEVVADILHQRASGRLEIFGSHHNIGGGHRQKVDAFLQKLATNPHVTIHGNVSHDEVLKSYARASAAVDLMPANLERELCFPTRTVEYLWAGVPVIHNNYSELAPYIADYAAGWSLCADDMARLADVCEAILDNPRMADDMAANAQKLVRENFTWDRTIEPIARFIEHPVMTRLTREMDSPLRQLMGSGVSQSQTPRAASLMDKMRARAGNFFKNHK